jgi:hypothetical protein
MRKEAEAVDEDGGPTRPDSRIGTYPGRDEATSILQGVFGPIVPARPEEAARRVWMKPIQQVLHAAGSDEASSRTPELAV